MKILLIEDEPNVASFIKKGLEEQTYEVEVAYDGLTGASLALQNFYDLIILDVILPHRNGIEVCRKIREGGNVQVPVLMLTALGSTQDIVTGLDAGADDYLTKPFKFQELVARVRALGRRKQAIPAAASTLSLGDLEMNLDTKTVTRQKKEIKLTSREFALLEFLLRSKNRVISKAEIAENVWEVDFDTGSNVVEVYINYLRNKIDKGFSPKLIHTVVGMGYMLKEGSES